MLDPKKPQILLVEDSEDDAFFFKRTLQKSGLNCSISHVANGAEAVGFLEKVMGSDSEDFPQVIFLDLKMPVLNGFEVLDWMQRQNFPVHIRVIVLSGSEHQDDKKRAAHLGATDYLVKPIKITDLQRHLQAICSTTNPEVGVTT
jgi:CheY-like chemotaxis protein